jgi:bifunctional UDP-N-acetylglucosamine pyrophosphorylase/glucosamine-1-phosphate N-acetyltransferase
MNEQLSIIILAAGKGSRMKSSAAKVLHTISGRPMLYHIIKSSLALTDDVTVVVSHQKEAVTGAMQEHFDGLAFVTQDTDRYPGTGGALKNVSPRYDKVLVLNGDMPLITPDALAGFRESDADITMSIFDLEDPSGYGRVVTSEVGVERIVEEKDATEAEKKIRHVNAGVYAFRKSVLESYLPKLSSDNAQGEYYLTDIIALAKGDGLSVEPLLVDEEHFKGVNSRLDLAAAEMIMQRRIREKWMQSGVSMQLPETIYIEEGVTFEGECLLENGVRITGESRLVNAHVKAHSVVEESVLIDSDVGPMAHLRPASRLEGTHIGNFVEVKKSSLRGVKAGHLSYLGDATIDEGTNIGAGVITCNYDGKKKYETRIGKNVFLGSDTQIIAPCTIADDVMIAAGTTVTSRQVESGVLLLSRAKIRKVENFFYSFFGKEKS